jgi:gliding motility-associated-like protein
MLNAFNSAVKSYTWQNNSTQPDLPVSAAGEYWVKVEGVNGCINADTIKVASRSLPKFSLGKDTTLCLGEELVLNPKITNVSYGWQNGSTAATFKVNNPGTYSLTVTNECGSASDEIIVTNGICQLYMPNAFTPNNDGVNDVFRVKNPGFIEKFRMTVYNRWGEIVFLTTDPYKGWDGIYKNAAAPMGNYVWQISLTSKNGPAETTYGNVVLIR